MRKLSIYLVIFATLISFPQYLFAQENNGTLSTGNLEKLENTDSETESKPENDENIVPEETSQINNDDSRSQTEVLSKKNNQSEVSNQESQKEKQLNKELPPESEPPKVDEGNSEQEDVKFKTLQIQSAPTIVEQRTSKLSHIRSRTIRIYENLANLQKYKTAGTFYTNQVYYVKLQAKVKNDTYYLISTAPSSTSGVVGWVKSSDLSSYNHIAVDKYSKSFYIKGTGSAYNKVWGGSKNLVYSSLSIYKGKEFKVNLTETVGKNLWYRGILGGKTVWIHSSYLTNTNPGSSAAPTSSTSRLGHIRSSSVKIYTTLGKESSAILAGSTYTNRVYYIKKQAKLNGQLYYLISLQPSSTKGTIGWIKASDLSTHTHVTVDKKAKTFYIKGTGNAYGKAWGGKKDLIYNLTDYKDQVFNVHLTEKVGNNIWYRGKLNGKTVWIHNSYLTGATTSSTSRLGHIRSAKVQIYKTLGDKATAFSAGPTYTNKVYYIKRQAIINNNTYYLLSNMPSSTNGIVGWAKASDLSTHPHVGVDKKAKILFIKGTGKAFSKAWGGSKDLVFSNMSQYANQEFRVNLTEKVGNNIWYRGVFKGKTIWLHSSYVTVTNTRNTHYNISYQEALARQMKINPPPQTDLYKNQNAYIHADYVKITRSATITGNGVKVRTAPKFGDNIAATLSSGTKVTFIKDVQGDLHAGSTLWYEIKYDNKVMYVHSSLANKNAIIAETTAKVQIHERPNTNSHVFATVNAETKVNIIKEGTTWHEISFNAWRNAKSGDVEKYLNPNSNNQFQHLLLSGSAGVQLSDLQKLLAGKGILNGKEKTFLDVSRKNNVNEVYLVAHALLETGNGTSRLATGVEVGVNDSGSMVVVTNNNRNSLKDIKKVYNMFGVAAYDSNPINGGAKYAYQAGWTTPEKAITGGAKWISEKYINNPTYKQNTLYKMRWNPSNPGVHQYATDIGWALKQTNRIKSVFDNAPNAKLQFDIPVYK